MHVLSLSPELPYAPGAGGFSTRQFHLLRRLVELGHEATVVAPVTVSQRDQVHSLPAAGVRLQGRQRPSSRVQEALRAVAQRPTLALEAIARPLLAWQDQVLWTVLAPIARRAVAQRRPDVIAVESDNAISWAADVDPSIPAVVTLHDVSWSYYQRRAAATRGARAAALATEARRFLRYDLRHLQRYRTVITVSEHERDAVRRVSDARVEVVPNGVDTGTIEALPERAGEPTVLFAGTMSHPPNVEGIGWFAEQVWPAVSHARPRAQLLIVGRDPPARIRRLAGERVQVTGEVASMAPYLERATVAIVPLRSGGGTRLKLLEALAAGRAVVSSSIGAEGINVSDGQDVLLADTPQDFATAVILAIDDPQLRGSLARRGRLLAERYDWRALGDHLERVLLSSLG